MKITDRENNTVIELLNIKRNGSMFDMDIEVNYFSPDDDMICEYITHTQISFSDLCYIKDKLSEILNNTSPGFGFSSWDKHFGIWEEAHNLGCECTLNSKDGHNSSSFFLFFSSTLDCNEELRESIQDILDNNSLDAKMICPQLSNFSIEYVSNENHNEDSITNHKIRIISKNFKICRKLHNNTETLKSIKEKISDFKVDKLPCFSIHGDFFKISFIKIGNMVEIRGDISDFSWPTPNRIIFHELTIPETVDSMYVSLLSCE